MAGWSVVLIVAVVLAGIGLDRRRGGDDTGVATVAATGDGAAVIVGGTAAPAGGAAGGAATGAGTGGGSDGAATVPTGAQSETDSGAQDGTETTLPAALGLPPATMVSTTLRPGQTVPSTSVAPSSGAAPGSTAAGPPTTAPPVATTTPGTAPCDLSRIVAQTETTFDGIEHHSVRCAQNWATWVGTPVPPADGDSFIAVARWTGSRWQLRNLGTSEVCTGAEVPRSLWGPLGCID